MIKTFFRINLHKNHLNQFKKKQCAHIYVNICGKNDDSFKEKLDLVFSVILIYLLIFILVKKETKSLFILIFFKAHFIQISGIFILINIHHFFYL